MKNIGSPCRPLRIITVRSATSIGRSMWAILNDCGRRERLEEGTCATNSQVLVKSRRRASAAKPFAIMPVTKAENCEPADHDQRSRDQPAHMGNRHDVAA